MFWLGATLRRSDLKWVWKHNGQEVTYSNWDEEAILNDPGSTPTTGYDCGFITGSGKWQTYTCSILKARVVCQDL